MGKPNYSFLKHTKEKNTGGIWSGRKTSYQSSNYWLRDSIFERNTSFFDDPTSVKESSVDYVQLAQYQRAISNFVRILTGRNDINVVYNDGSTNATDGKTITISPKIKEKEFDTAVGLALHEASHVLYTDFEKATKTFNDYRESRGWFGANNFKYMLNLVEDLYIDAMTYKSSPGYRGYYASLYQKYFGNEKIVDGFWANDYCEPTWDNYLFHLVNIRNPKRNLGALPGLRPLFRLIDLPTITRLDTQEKRIGMALSIFMYVSKLIKKHEEEKSSSSQQGSSNPNDAMDVESPESMPGGANGGLEFDNNNMVNDTPTGSNYSSNNEKLRDLIDSEDSYTRDSSQYSDLTQSEKEKIDKLVKKQRDLIEGSLEKGKISKKDALLVNSFAAADIEKKVVGENEGFSQSGKGIPCYIIRNITDAFVNGAGHQYGFTHHGGYQNTSMADKINQAIVLGRALAKRLQLRNEERVLKSTRLDSGKIDKRLLHEIGFDNFDIFSKINITSYKPAYIHLSLDQSYSMGGEMWDGAIFLAAMFATASKLIPNIHLQITTRSSFNKSSGYGGNSQNLPYIMYIFDSKKHGVEHIRKYFSRLKENANTPEGLCFNSIQREVIQQSANTDAYFINICDGEPAYGYNEKGTSFIYQGAKARKHSHDQMKTMERNGIKYLAYFLSESTYGGWGGGGLTAIRECYGENVVHIKRASEISSIAKSMNRKLLS